jgi:hypothetical protein
VVNSITNRQPLMFSGLASGTDTASMIDQILSAKRIPITDMQVRVSDRQRQSDAIKDISGRLNNLLNQAKKFVDTGFTQAKTASAAAGIDQQRGDQLVIAMAAFSGNQLETITEAKPAITDSIMRYAKIGVPIAVALLVLFVVWRMNRSVAPRQARAITLSQPALPPGNLDIAYALGGSDDATMSILRPSSAPALPEPETPDRARRRQQMQDRMIAMATTNPDAAAEIIQTWIRQDERKN